MIIDEIYKANVVALKSRDLVARVIYSVLIGKYKALEIELRAQGKEVSDTDVVKLISKLVKELDEEIESYEKAGRNEDVTTLKAQKALIEKYLPKLMSEEDIKKIIDSLDDKSMPSIMKHFKMNYDGQVDMSLVSKIARGQ